ncbi:MAG: hypothetical protein IE909_08730 [Campylobacterales bacterium]|nr:hypothetical protein [Campylobacterales bacterium]
MTKKYLYLFFFVLLFSISVIYFYYFNKASDEFLSNISDKLSVQLQSNLHDVNDRALQLAVVLSNNKTILKACRNNDEDVAYTVINDVVKSIKTLTKKLVRVQMITKEKNIFVRSWDNVYAGMPIEEYRHDLNYFEHHHTPRVSLEVGRKLGIRATIPIYLDKHLWGFIEVIEFIEPIVSFFQERGTSLYVLVDDSFYEQAILMRYNETIGNYIIANTNYNASFVPLLRSIDFQKLKTNRMVVKDGMYVFFESMYNGEGDTIGVFVFVVDKENLQEIQNKTITNFLPYISRENIYRLKIQNNTMFDDLSIEDLIAMQYMADNEIDKEFLKEKIKQKLQPYSKDQIVNLFLEGKMKKKISGEIE